MKRSLVWLKIESCDKHLSTEKQTSILPGLSFAVKSRFLACYADSLAKQFPMFRRIVVPSSSE